MIDYQALGKRIRAARLRMDLPQHEVARRTCLSPSFLGHLERGTRIASLDSLVSIANTLNVSIEYLLSDSLLTDSTAPTSTDTLRAAAQVILDWCERAAPCDADESCN